MVLENIRLIEKRNTRVGQATDKTLSGGERKRLNIGLELLSNAEMYFLDEPTSGLSSKDSEKIMEILADLAMSGKIVVVVIHQPGSKLFKMFNKLILLDNGGRLAYYGSAYSALEYFKRHMEMNLPADQVEVECQH
jgi:ABC-type multidrug transport system ATPase subunit